MNGQNSVNSFKHRSVMLALAAMVALASAPAVRAQEDNFFGRTKRLGRAAVEYRDPEIHVVAAYYYSQRNHNTRWLLIQSAMSTTRNLVIDRENITLVTPSGERVITLASQQRFASDVARVHPVVQSAYIHRHDVLSYFNEKTRIESMRLFALNSGAVLTNFVTDKDHVITGDLFFESPTGLWDSGTYSLIIEREGARAVLPIVLQ
jgi:hypothetical protein